MATEVDSVLEDLGRRLDLGERPTTISTPSLGPVLVTYVQNIKSEVTYAYVEYTLPEGWEAGVQTEENADHLESGQLRGFFKRLGEVDAATS